jgi:formate C-acetyltransferase
MDRAGELVEAFYIKLMENAIWPRDIVNFCNMTVGGCDAMGNDIGNDLTWLALDTLVKTKSTHPLLSFRWHENVDKDLWKRAVSVVGVGTGLPAIFSDPLMIAALESWGVDRALAAEYGVVGCVEPALVGLLHGQTLGAHVNTLMCLELALNDGRRIGHTEQLGPQTGCLCDFKTMDDIMQAYETQVRHACAINRDCVYAVAKAQQACFGYPLMSSLMHGALERGQDLTKGVTYNFPTVCITGVTNVLDSLLSIEELVFESGDYSFSDLYDALMANYEGYEDLLVRIRASQNRFGNGQPRYVDLYNRICEAHTGVLETQPGPRGGYFAPGLWTTGWYVQQGRHTGPSLDGRRAGEPIADGAGPVSGRVYKSPTAVARDMAGVDAVRHYPGGYVHNQKFSSSLFRSEEQLEKLADYIETYLKIGGMQMQINVHSKALLMDALENPDKHRDLVVRVAGFSAYFTTLDPGVQEEIATRAVVEV